MNLLDDVIDGLKEMRIHRKIDEDEYQRLVSALGQR
jgi:hypothetical protein